MASACILLCVVVSFILETAASNSFVNVQCKAQAVGQFGQNSLLSCVVSTIEEVRDIQIQAVVWAKEDVEDPVLFFRDDEELKTSSFRYSFAQPSWNNRNMNVSLLIRDTAPKDEGVYKCTVYTDSGINDGQTSLKVTAKYSQPTFEAYPENLDMDTGGSVTCKSSGYPQGQLRWFDKDNKKWLRQPPTEVEKTESGLLRLSSKMTLLPRSSFSKYICRVFNAKGEPEAENYYTVKDSPNTGEQTGNGGDGSSVATKIVAPVVVIGSLIVGLLLWLLLNRRRSQQARRHSAAPLISEHAAVPAREYDADESQEMKKLAEV